MRNTQYIIIDSQFVSGTNNAFSVTFGNTSNTFVQEMRDVIGIKAVDFYFTNVGTSTNQYIDVLCLDVPTAGQILNERTAQLLLRVPLERNISGSNNLVIYDKQWIPFKQETSYFNPITIKNLRFRINALQSDGSYVPLQPGIGFTMTLEITTMDHNQPKEDTNLLVVEAIKKLSKRMDRLNVSVTNIPVVKPEDRSKISVKYVMLILAFLIAGFLIYAFMQRSSTSPASSSVGGVSAPVPVRVPQVPGVPGLPLRPPGALQPGFL